MTAIRARAKSNGYVNDCDVMPANEPAKKRRPLVFVPSLSTCSTFRHCSCAVNCMAAYGMIRAIVAEFPRYSATKPSV